MFFGGGLFVCLVLFCLLVCFLFVWGGGGGVGFVLFCFVFFGFFFFFFFLMEGLLYFLLLCLFIVISIFVCVFDFFPGVVCKERGWKKTVNELN